LGAVWTPCDSEKPSLQAVAVEIMLAKLNSPDLLIMFKLLHTNRAGALGKISRVSSIDYFPEMEVKDFHEDIRISGTLQVNVPVIVIGTTFRVTNHSIHTLRGGTCRPLLAIIQRNLVPLTINLPITGHNSLSAFAYCLIFYPPKK
jgi:hypothetical protein